MLIEDKEKAIESILNVLQDALRAVSRRSRGNCKSIPWWIPECKSVQLTYISIVATTDRLAHVKILMKILSAAKRKYWKGVVEKMESPKEIFKLTR